jgi:hypothetical protein
MRRLFLTVLLASGLLASDVRVPVAVAAAAEEAPLKRTDFEAVVEGAGAANIVRIRTPKDDLLLMLIMDTVGDLAFVEPARRALAQRFAELPPRTHITILRAQDGPRVITDPTSNPETLTQSLAAIPIAGKSALLDTIDTASNLADAVALKSNVRVAILYVTDSDVRNYREDFTNPVINSSDSRDLSRRFPEGLIRERITRLSTSLSAFQTPVFIVHLRPSASASRLDEAYQTGLVQLATATGGEARLCRSSAEIPDAIAQTLDKIAAQYRVHVQLPPKARKPVVVNLQSGNRQLTYRKSFVVR